MGVPTSEVGYTPAMPRREGHEVHKGHVVALDKKKITGLFSVHSHGLQNVKCHEKQIRIKFSKVLGEFQLSKEVKDMNRPNSL